MADETIRLLREGDREEVGRLIRGHLSLFAGVLERSRDLSGLTEEAFGEGLIGFLAGRCKSAQSLTARLQSLLQNEDLVLLVGLLHSDERSRQVGLERVREEYGHLMETCQAALPGLYLDETEFHEAILQAACIVALRRDLSLSDAIAKGIRFPDFYLAAAALSKDSGVARKAAALFTDKYLKLAQAYVRRRWSTVPNAEEKVNSLFFCALYEHTLSEKTGNPSNDETRRPPLLAEYRGQGPLAAWLTLSLGNMIRDGLRTAKPHDSLDEEREVGGEGSVLPKTVVSVEEDQRTGLDRNRCVTVLREGLRIAWATLKPREKLTLTLQTLMEVPPSIIARNIFHVHEGTITKYTTNALRKIRDALEAHALQACGMSAEDVENCFEFLREAFPETETLAGGIVAAAGDMESS
jgi:DNA-directed RNA polymerase specialized sigma24 family protein